MIDQWEGPYCFTNHIRNGVKEGNSLIEIN